MPKVDLRMFQSAPEDSGLARNVPRRSKQTLNPEIQSPRANLKEISFIGSVRRWLQSDVTGASMGTLVILFLGMLFFLIRFHRNFLDLKGLVTNATPIRALGRVRVVVADSIAIPFSVRLGLTSWVVLPTKIIQNANDFRLALGHEIQHHRQGDTSWAVIVEFLLCLFFPNPVIYLWKKEITELQEFSCDEALIGRKGISSHEYGSCLVRVAEAALGIRQMYVGTTCMAAASKNPSYFKSFLRRRVEMFENYKSSPKGFKARWAGVIIGTAGAILTVALAFGADQTLRNPNQQSINPGKVVVDPEIQKIADTVLAKAVQDEKAKAGFAIVADPNTGKILAVANIDTTGKKTGYWSLSELFEPASIAKSLVVAQALENGATTPEEKHACENGNYRYGDRVYHDWKKTGWDYLSTEETLTWSSDICTIKISEKIGADGLIEMLKGFGFGPDGTAKTFPQAKTGQLPSSDEDPQRPRVVPYVSMGAGFSISPIEMVQAYGAIANGGNLMLPMMANKPDSEAQIVRRILSPEASQKMRLILQQVVEKGTAVPGRSKVYSEAGKTASSSYPRSMPFDPNESDFAGFIGFAPAKDPRLEIYVGMIEPESNSGAHGGSHAAPVFRAIAEETLKFLKVAPDKP
ncbi:MAG: penicillin-binding transpeptidase domain-containing protein [Bacteriovoracia bacterium]